MENKESKEVKNFGYDLSLIIKTFGIEVTEPTLMIGSNRIMN